MAGLKRVIKRFVALLVVEGRKREEKKKVLSEVVLWGGGKMQREEGVQYEEDWRMRWSEGVGRGRNVF